ncbi:gibberellin 3-beta-dioxygenase 2-like [Aristolochia californica]|uniref:gibberellin 3-beta-dioxygenase 2-like n=1 Tax=Aristolochia californica TaxID=171875 RepID=UPI0035DB18DE
MSSLTEAIMAHPGNLHQPRLDFETVHEVPDSHAWPQLQDYPCGGEDDRSLNGQSPIPVIDLTQPDAATRMGQACEKWGAFQLTNHGIPMRLLDNVEFQARRLFALPAQQKLKAARPPDGLTGYGIARISTFFSKLLWSEGFTIAGSPAEHAHLLWTQPQECSQFCEAMEEYDKEMKKLARRLMWLMLASLEISKEEVTWAGQGGEMVGASSVLQLNWYPACPNPERAMGLAEHTDSPLFAILYQSSTSGLQVLGDDEDGGTKRWVTVPPLRGALVVNVGDLLHMFTNGRFKSVLHRAVVNRSRHRLSVAYFWGPPSNVWLSPLDKLVGPESSPLYPSMSWSEYLKFKARHFNKSLSLLRLQALRQSTADRFIEETATDDRNGGCDNKTSIKAC